MIFAEFLKNLKLKGICTKEDRLNKKISGICDIEELKDRNCIVFLFSRFELKKEHKDILAIFIDVKLKDYYRNYNFDNIFFISGIKLYFAKALNLLYKNKWESFISKKAVISPKAIIDKDVFIGDNVYIGDNSFIGKGSYIDCNVVIKSNVFIGDNVKIFSNAVIMDKTKIGNNVIIYPGAIIGSDGFGFERDENGLWYKIPQIGRVILQDNVEIGALTTIDKATLGETIIGFNTKIDNLCQIAHNVIIGKNCVIASQVGIAGSTIIGDNVMIGGKVGIRDHIEIGNNCIIAAGSHIWNNMKDNSFYSGIPAIDHRKNLKRLALIDKLPEIFKFYKENIKKNT